MSQLRIQLVQMRLLLDNPEWWELSGALLDFFLSLDTWDRFHRRTSFEL